MERREVTLQTRAPFHRTTFHYIDANVLETNENMQCDNLYTKNSSWLRRSTYRHLAGLAGLRLSG